MRTRVQAGQIASNGLKRKLKSDKSKKRSARRSVKLKSASWYANAALLFGVSAKSETSIR